LQGILFFSFNRSFTGPGSAVLVTITYQALFYSWYS
jgi:hypothetical protein